MEKINLKRLKTLAMAGVLTFALIGSVKAQTVTPTIEQNTLSDRVDAKKDSDWGEWSEWSTTAVERDEFTQVEKQVRVSYQNENIQVPTGEFETLIVDKVIIPTKEMEDIAWEVIKGNYGNQSNRELNLQQNGYDYEIIQVIVNNILAKFAPDQTVIRPDNYIIADKAISCTETKTVPILADTVVRVQTEETLYRYRTKTIISTNSSDWSEWSEWSTTEIQPDQNTQVEKEVKIVSADGQNITDPKVVVVPVTKEIATTVYQSEQVPIRIIRKVLSTEELENIAWEVIKGNYENGQQRKENLSKDGYDLNEIQAIVNYILEQYHTDVVVRPDYHLTVGKTITFEEDGIAIRHVPHVEYASETIYEERYITDVEGGKLVTYYRYRTRSLEQQNVTNGTYYTYDVYTRKNNDGVYGTWQKVGNTRTRVPLVSDVETKYVLVSIEDIIGIESEKELSKTKK